eukprot:Sspe_Gene.98666::Locus_72062_Transcript_1_1_Confidence_1.000_Length_905::g.98666::m.98666
MFSLFYFNHTHTLSYPTPWSCYLFGCALCVLPLQSLRKTDGGSGGDKMLEISVRMPPSPFLTATSPPPMPSPFFSLDWKKKTQREVPGVPPCPSSHPPPNVYFFFRHFLKRMLLQTLGYTGPPHSINSEFMAWLGCVCVCVWEEGPSFLPHHSPPFPKPNLPNEW